MVALTYVAAFALLAITPVLATSSGSPTHLFARQISGFDPSSIPSSCLQNQCEDLINVFSASNGCTTPIASAPTVSPALCRSAFNVKARQA
ncbi:hypothetical protein CPB84DRAFT_1225730 [Gymnopilus junonius]|uniref:Uncharacterized protein n=1 Tax=Gymnopilus junonius TaxID=109634 RepID=A0A9P5P0C5_GYMJU|nr:hypothetical protein CPB84DRAFT_1225730 [Gymnopilus junonius]